MSELKVTILELEQVPIDELKTLAAVEIMGYKSERVYVFSAPALVGKIHKDGLINNMYYAMCILDGPRELNHLFAHPYSIDSYPSFQTGAMFGMYLMTLAPRKIIIAAIAAKRLSEISTEACVGATSSHDGTRLYPNHSTEQKPFNAELNDKANKIRVKDGLMTQQEAEQKPFATVAVDIQKDGAEVEECLAVDCLGCGHIKCPGDCPPEGDGLDPKLSKRILNES